MNTRNIFDKEFEVNAQVYKNYLTAEDSTFTKVQHSTATMENVIARAAGMTKQFDIPSLVSAGMLFSEVFHSFLEQGIGVDLFETGCLRPGVVEYEESDGSGNRTVRKIALRFTPSKSATEAANKAKVKHTFMVDTDPAISSVTDLFTHKADGTLTAGKPARIHGSRLKIAGEASTTGLYFAPVTDGKINADGDDWIRLEDGAFFRNTASYLEFTLSAIIQADKTYRLVLKTSANANGSLNKSVKTLVHNKDILVKQP